ncbi:MAG: DUF1579 domain-containing protein [Bacteroidota bacterium]|nr:DUF1579 domain-containing protein [Bacteroidota bacterium]
MKRITVTICTAAIFLFGCNNNKTTNDKTAATDSTKTTTDTSSSAMTPPMDSAAMMKCWMNYMTPGDVQKMIAKSNGTWDEEVTTWMEPGKPPTTSKATAVNTMILGGRYQESHHKGSFNGMLFEGVGTLGYDNAKKVLMMTWVDNMGTGIEYLEGPWDSTSHSANLKGKTTDPMTGKDMEVRQLFTVMDDNNQKVEMYATHEGKEAKMMEIVLKRKK